MQHSITLAVSTSGKENRHLSSLFSRSLLTDFKNKIFFFFNNWECSDAFKGLEFYQIHPLCYIEYNTIKTRGAGSSYN